MLITNAGGVGELFANRGANPGTTFIEVVLQLINQILSPNKQVLPVGLREAVVIRIKTLSSW